MTKCVLVAGTHSGCGKTSFTLGLLRALVRRGLRPAPFKTGPDFIDPGLHRLACGQISHNLDSWMLPPDANRALFARNARGADIAVIEGAMGLYDGLSGTDESGSAASMAKLLGVPVALVVDVSGMARSVAALVQGFTGFSENVPSFSENLPFAGVILNRTGGPGHREILLSALRQTRVPVLGCLAKAPKLHLPSRHLGLTTAEDLNAAENLLDGLADWVLAGVDLDALLTALPDIRCTPSEPSPLTEHHGEPSRSCTLGVARDQAFSFVYAENLRLLEAAGAYLVFFSPLKDHALPEGLDGLYLPGGYPELYAQALSANTAMLAALRNFCLSGRPVYAECGGFMLLSRAIVDQEGRLHPMAGIFDCEARMNGRFTALGYREVRFSRPTILGPADTVARGHEFHYSSLTGVPDAPACYELRGRAGAIDAPEGFFTGNTLGSYVHLHFASNPKMAAHFVAAMSKDAP